MSNGGGTLTLPSPTHPHQHHVDVSASLRHLRRSLSRSPSKLSVVRNHSQSSSDAGSSPSSPSLRRVQSQYFHPNSSSHSPPHGQSPLATPFRPGVKLSLRSAKSSKSPATSSKPLVRNRTSPKSPVRRALNPTPNTANSTPSSSSSVEPSAPGQENINIFGIQSPQSRECSEKTTSRHSMHLDLSGSVTSQPPVSRFPESNSAITATSVTSPLKRSDAIMNLDQTFTGSPRPKRRSCGPSNFGADFNIFDHVPSSPSPEIQDDANREYDWTVPDTTTPCEPLPSSSPSLATRRAGSLRRSTLQQRHPGERTSWGRRHAAQQLSQLSNDTSTPNVMKNRPRLSLDHFLPPQHRESPFNQAGPLPNPSAHMVSQQAQQAQQAQQTEQVQQVQQAHQPHPLSRTMTNSSSHSSMDESPTHFPVQISEKPKAPINFSKSLPIGVRPQFEKERGQAVASATTPDYKQAKPFLGAFASTGLVSKVNRNPELGPSGHGGGIGFIPPDTPCKKMSGWATYPPGLGSGKKGGKNMRQAIPEPGTPLKARPGRFSNDHQHRPVLFNGAGHTRKSSLLSIYSDEGRKSLENSVEDMTGIEGDVPPTPTRPQLVPHSSSTLSRFTNESPTTNRTANRFSAAPASSIGDTALLQQEAGASCKSTPLKGPCGDGRDEEDVVSADGASDVPVSVVRGPSPNISLSLPSFSRTRAKRGSFSTPAPLETTLNISLTKSVTKVRFAETDSVIPASPLERLEFAGKATPRTPQESVVPPDASRLSISNPAESVLFPISGDRKSIFTPATPTARQEGFPFTQERRAITPVNGMAPNELDGSLLSRFGRVDYIGKGEFSQVYRVSDVPRLTSTIQPGFFSTPTHRTPPSPVPGKTFAVKKLTLPFQGEKDRAFRIREVLVLKSLRGSDHVLQLIDSWEEKNSLYIQTEYCEEGSLDLFLSLVGVKGRLDDFRIWKIMLEISQGLRAIHNAGFIHLDLKPANVLINFEGTLKIGDFGLATALPAEKGFEIEGDRQYLAPEALRSDFDKPADIFSLGLIMLEIAANVTLPENGATWTALREGDFSEVPTLTPDATTIARDATGMPMEDTDRSMNALGGDNAASKNARRNYHFRGGNRYSGDIFGLARKSELQEPPEFMKDPDHRSSLDTVVRWMLSAEPMCRPTVWRLLELESLNWVASRQRAGATVFEGNWGPADESTELITLDTEMTDV